MYNLLRYLELNVAKIHISTIQTSFISVNFFTCVEIATNS